jgi:hypothetical protein
MFWMFRVVRRVIENPKLLIAFGVLLAFGLFLDFVVLSAPGNPLPEPDDVVELSFIGGEGGDGSPARDLDMGLYVQLRECLEGCNSLIHSGTGELAGTMVIRQANGRTRQARLYEWGLVQTQDGLFEAADGERANRLSSLIQSIPR